MSNVIELASRRHDPHIAGHATCLDCKLRWAAVAPVGTVHLQCPSCHTMRGVWNMPISLDGQYSVLSCECGCQHMLVMHERGQAMCVSCGLVYALAAPAPRPAA